jgi:hypothetical protein
MSSNIIFVLMYHCHKLLDLIYYEECLLVDGSHYLKGMYYFHLQDR